MAMFFFHFILNELFHNLSTMSIKIKHAKIFNLWTS